MIEVLAIDHVVLRTDKLEQMIAFYCEVLGCHLERQLESLGLYQLRAGNALIDLVSVDSELGRQAEVPLQQFKNVDHFCLQINQVDLAALKEFLTEKGVVIGDIANRYGATGFGESVYILDPQRNIIELKFV